jgi:hypothetical protein
MGKTTAFETIYPKETQMEMQREDDIHHSDHSYGSLVLSHLAALVSSTHRLRSVLSIVALLGCSGLGLLPSMALASNTSASVIGTTVAEVNAKFVGVITANLEKSTSTKVLASMSANELQDLAYGWARNSGGNTLALSALIQKSAPTQSARFALAITNARAAYTGTNPTLTARMRLIEPEVSAPTPPYPTLDMTLEEIYLEFRTAGEGLSVLASLWETATFAGTNLFGAFTAGYTVGLGIDWLVQTYDPLLWDDIGNLEGSLVNALGSPIATSSSFMTGLYQTELAQQMHFSMSTVYNGVDIGSWGVADDVLAYDDEMSCDTPGACL